MHPALVSGFHTANAAVLPDKDCPNLVRKARFELARSHLGSRRFLRPVRMPFRHSRINFEVVTVTSCSYFWWATSPLRLPGVIRIARAAVYQPKLVLMDGIEPPTPCSSGTRSTSELHQDKQKAFSRASIRIRLPMSAAVKSCSFSARSVHSCLS